MKKLGGVDEDEKGDTIFNIEEHVVEEQKTKRIIWIGYLLGGYDGRPSWSFTG